MTKKEFKDVLVKAIGGTAYGDALIKDLVDHFDETGKYAQTAKDRLDEHIATLNGWAKKHEAEGETAKAVEEEANVKICEIAMKALGL